MERTYHNIITDVYVLYISAFCGTNRRYRDGGTYHFGNVCIVPCIRSRIRVEIKIFLSRSNSRAICTIGFYLLQRICVSSCNVVFCDFRCEFGD